MSYSVRPMQRKDIAQVTAIDREAFPTLWPPTNYEHERQNPLARYTVACDDRITVAPTPRVPRKGLAAVPGWVRHLFNRSRFFGNAPPPPGNQYVVGFAGMWIVADEAHITNIAARKSHRRQGIGERLLIATIDLARELKAHVMTLEVRASNTAAQALYSKYGFNQVGVRRGYYVDNKEDAILMTTEDVSSASFQAHFEQLKQAYSRKWENQAPVTE